MFKYLHCYLPETWDAQMKAGLINKNSGLRICESIDLEDDKKFKACRKRLLLAAFFDRLKYRSAVAERYFSF